jgi:enamine deaminase RidA (YjgF/YER057c/UK114 family)
MPQKRTAELLAGRHRSAVPGGSDGAIRGRSIVEQFDVAAGNVAAALAAAGGKPEHLVYMAIYVTDVAEYRASLRDLGTVYRRHLGHHYPAMALVGVSALFDDARRSSSSVPL